MARSRNVAIVPVCVGAAARAAAVALAALLSAPAAADEYSDFRIPPHRLYGWTAGLSSGGDIAAQGDDALYQSSRVLQGVLSTRGFWISDSDPSHTSIDWNASAGGDRSRRRDQTADPQVEARSELFQKSAAESWQVSLDQRVYPFPFAFGIAGSAFAASFYRQNWSHSNQDDRILSPAPTQRNIVETHQDQWDYHYLASGSLAFGLGRVRDATGVLDARVFEQRLLRAGALARPLSNAGRARLAALAYVQYGYSSVHERAGKYLWRAIERVLREDGALADSVVDPSAVLRAAEPYVRGADGSPASLIPRSPVPRAIGLFAGPIVTAAHAHDVIRLDLGSFEQVTLDDSVVFRVSASQSARFAIGSDQLFGGGMVEYHRPLGPRWQVDALEQVQFPLRPHRQGLEVRSGASVQAIVADRWTAGVSVGHERSIEHARPEDEEPNLDRWSVSFGATLAVYLEDRIQLVVQAVEDQSMARVPNASFFPGSSRTGFSRAGRAVLQLTYRFLGGLDAPGLITPLRIGTRAE